MYSLYLHIPFCSHRCAYCDFNTYAGKGRLIPDYAEALCGEICVVAASAPGRLAVHTVFFGGGTPSMLTTTQLESILAAIRGCFSLAPGAEISLEANPGTCSRAYLRELRSLGFNRLSLGAQSAHPDELRQLERIHDYFDVLEAVTWARRAGFDNLNLDLIYGLPEQSLARWQSTLKLALELHPEHLSLYALAIEPGTPFGRWAARGLLPIPDPDLAAEMYEWVMDFLAASGYEHYEISNWAKPDHQCRHNLQYWRNQPYLGFGAGAHGYANGLRVANALRVKTYIERCAHHSSSISFPLSPATVNHTPVTPRDEMQETMITGLRLTKEGISAAGFQARFGVSLQETFGREIDNLVGLGLLEWVDSQTSDVYKTSEVSDNLLRLTRRGRLLGNQVFMCFVE